MTNLNNLSLRFDVSGVYYIRNIYDGKMYIGKSERSIADRIRQHREELEKHTHHNRFLQEAFTTYGAEAFLVGLIVSLRTPRYIQLAERILIRQYQGFLYNIEGVFIEFRDAVAAKPVSVQAQEAVSAYGLDMTTFDDHKTMFLHDTKLVQKMQEMQKVALEYRNSHNGEEMHKVNLLRQVWDAKPGNNPRYKAASKVYQHMKDKGLL